MSRELSPAELGELRHQLDAAREAWDEFSAAWADLREGLRQADLFVSRQVEAYQPFTRDQGMGDEPETWLRNIEAAIEGGGEDDES